MHNGHTKPRDRERTDQRSHDRGAHDDIDSRNDETFGDAALGMWLLIPRVVDDLYEWCLTS